MHIPSHSVHTAAHCNPLQPKAKHPVHTLQQPLHLQCTHCSSHYIFSAHTATAITSSVHTLQQPLHLQCTLQPCTAMYSYLQPIFSAHCSQLQPSATTYTAAILSRAHCSYSIQCTLQLYYPVHTAAILSSAHCSYTIYTVHPVNHHRVSLHHYWHTSRAVSRH